MSIPGNYKEFRLKLHGTDPPGLWPEALKALWWDAIGNWEVSHEIAQDLPSETGSWIHAYLHRKEGDDWNAGYWYRRANKPFPTLSLEEEVVDIVRSILENGT